MDTVHLDVCSQDSIKQSVAVLDGLTGGRGPDILLNNAGYAEVGPLDLVDDAALRRQFEINVFGLMAVTRAYLPRMQERRSGRIINIASIVGHVAPAFWGAYAASKHAVEGLSDSLRQECAPFGIKVSIIEPWLVRSNFANTAFDTLTKYDFSKTPWGNFFTSEQIARDHKQYDKLAVPPDVVSQAIYEACTSTTPKARYMVPWWATIVVKLISNLPEDAGDWVAAKLGGVDLSKAVSQP